MAFSYSSQSLDALRRAFSDERLSPYLELANDDLETAIRLYELNVRLSSDLYGPIQGVEVAVRNALDETLRSQFGEDWTDLSTIPLLPNQTDDVGRATQAAFDKRADGDYSHGDVVAELSLGFWTSVLGPKNEVELWRKCLWKAFPNRPKGTERKAVQGALNSVRRLRNRIAHHCRIIHRDLVEDHATILEVTRWVCADTSEWIASQSKFDPSAIPVPQTSLPFDGVASIDPIPPSAEPKQTLGGRPRLGVKSQDGT